LFLFMLASLEGYSDSVFRALCFRHGADLTFTEMSHVESLLNRNRGSLEKIAARDATPVQVQILSSGVGKVARFLSGFEPFEGFMGFNLNLSCPSRDVIRRGKGAAMVKRSVKTQGLVSLIRDFGFPVSVKLRLGLNQFEKDNKLYLNCLRDVDPDFFVVHAKHAGQGSGEAEDYSVYPECVEAARGLPVIANGGIDSVEKVRMLMDAGVGGVMIGRAALGDPSIFDRLKNELRFNSPPRVLPGLDELRAEYRRIYDDLGGQEKYLADFFRVAGKGEGVRY
jgi:tRNA-dihydrouridine synthase B